MLDDRTYMRNVSFGPAWSATKAILYANVAFFIIQQILLHYTSVPLVKYFYLSKEGIAHGFVFQLVTYQFLHGGLFHLFCNLLVIYFFGKALEEGVSRYILRLGGRGLGSWLCLSRCVCSDVSTTDDHLAHIFCFSRFNACSDLVVDCDWSCRFWDHCPDFECRSWRASRGDCGWFELRPLCDQE